MKAIDSVKGIAKLAEIKKDARELVKNAQLIKTDFVSDLPATVDDEALIRTRPDGFNQKPANPDDLALLVHIKIKTNGYIVRTEQELEKHSVAFRIMRKYGLTHKYYHIEEDESLDKSIVIGNKVVGTKKLGFYVFVHFPHDKIPSPTFWQALGFEAAAYENKRKANDIYKEFTKKESGNKR